MKIISTITILYFLLFPNSAFADKAYIRAELLFKGGSEEAERSVDDFQNTLATLDGQIVRLDLTLLNSNPETGKYTIKRIPSNPSVETDTSENIVCGTEGIIGLIDNRNMEYEISFNRPSDYHGPTSIYIGNRRDYPTQSIKCGIKEYTSSQETPLHIRGYFFVEVSSVPTAFDYVLFPVDIK